LIGLSPAPKQFPQCNYFSIKVFPSKQFEKMTNSLWDYAKLNTKVGVGKNRGIAVIGNGYKKLPIRKWTYRKKMMTSFPISPKMDHAISDMSKNGHIVKNKI
jgi:hypothetical protein